MAKSVIGLQRSFRRRASVSTVVVLLSAGCSSSDDGLGSRRVLPPAAPDPVDLVAGNPGMGLPSGVLQPIDAHAIVGIEPAHGPFRGGQIALIRGNGFSSQVRVWFGDVEVPAEQVTATRSDRIQVTVPAGAPGAVAITTQNADLGSSRRSLVDGYAYDSFFADPDVGPTSGGGTITLVGASTAWDDSTIVLVGNEPCEVVAVRGAPGGPQELDCRAPSGSEGQKSISITSGGVIDTVNGAFSYEPGEVLRGGLSGEPLAARLSVHVTAPGGRPIAGAYVILGSDLDLATLGQPGAAVQRADAEGRAVFAGDFATRPLVTVAARCFQPLSFVDVPVDTVRAELLPVASPDCASGLPQASGGVAVRPVIVRGELVWRGGVEFQRSAWTNVPEAQRENERRAAYIFQPSGDAESRFRLPREESAITPNTPGETGYPFEVVTGGGSRTFYALAGIENRSVNPPRFTAYAMGILRGLFANSGETIEGVAIPMDRTLDQALTLDVTGPAATERGPDFIDVRVAVQISGGFAIFPNALLEAPLQSAASLGLVGLPALLGDLEGARYAIGARAMTGLTRAAPFSVLPMITADNAIRTIVVDDFVPVPTLALGSDDELTWNRELRASWAETGRAVALVHYDIRSGSGLIAWTIAAPPSAVPFRLPDLSRLPEGDLMPGALEAVVSLASLPDFDYATLRADQLRRGTWEAYAADVVSTRYERSPQ